MDREAIARLRRAFEAGFAASGEGWNGEHNTADSNTEFAEWISEAFASWYNETADAPALTPPPGAGGVSVQIRALVNSAMNQARLSLPELPSDKEWRAVEEPITTQIAALLASPSPLACTEIAMGHGRVDVGEFGLGERRGLLLHPRADHIPMGQDGSLQNVEYRPVPGDVVIWIDDPAGADVIRSMLDAVSPRASPNPQEAEGWRGLTPEWVEALAMNCDLRANRGHGIHGVSASPYGDGFRAGMLEAAALIREQAAARLAASPTPQGEGRGS